MNKDRKALTEAEELAYFRTELVDISPESYSLEEKKQISEDMDKASAAIEDAMREDFSKLNKVTQTMLLDKLGVSGYRDREWWRRMLMDETAEPGKPTL
ncbi:hypothetical protein [Rubneribacter badeniensis]|uniref:hypothetical protein n=1 Tax=Rubneribacter badeniensis TaxID=2070688 RepID=UPI003A91D1AE